MLKLQMYIGAGLLFANMIAYVIYDGAWGPVIRRSDKWLRNAPGFFCGALLIYLLWTISSKRIWRGIVAAVACIFLLMEISQFIYLSQTGEYLSILALENIDQVYILIRPIHIALIVFVVVALLFYGSILMRWPGFSAGSFSRRTIAGIVVALMILTAYNNAYEFVMNPKYAKYFRHGQPTPAVNLVLNMYRTYFPAVGSAAESRYTFEKDWVYREDLPFLSKTASVKEPNVIVILTEGTSTRLLGCYGGAYNDLTPNFDDFSHQSMKVMHYYNHTSATYRGTLGQMASCYPFRGGKEAGAWNKEQKDLWSTLNYSTVPKILGDDYETLFFSPHESADSYTDLVRMAGFSRVETKDTLPDVLGTVPEIMGDSFTDDSMYRSLSAYLEHRDENRPFFLVMYTVGTHAGMDIPPDGEVYGDGSNPTLNTLHNVDAAFGRFWKAFQASPYKDNTIVIVTADHAHVQEKPYVALVKDDPTYKPYFVDTVPLLIYDPTHNLPAEYDADDATGLALAPTILQLLGRQYANNAFLGASLFDGPQSFHIHAEGNALWYIHNHEVFSEKDIPEDAVYAFMNEKKRLYEFYAEERENRMIRP